MKHGWKPPVQYLRLYYLTLNTGQLRYGEFGLLVPKDVGNTILRNIRNLPTIRSETPHHIPEDMNHQRPSSEKLKSHKY